MGPARRIALRVLLVLAPAAVALPAPPAAAAPPATVVTCAKARAENGQLRRLERCGRVDPRLGPERAARSALARLSTALDLDPDSLVLSAVRHSPLGTHVRFTQQIAGVPVDGANVLVGYGDDGSVRIVHSSARRPGARVGKARMTRDEAIAVARARVGAGVRLRAAPTAQLVLASELAWRVLVPTARPIADRSVLVADAGGDVLEDTDRSWSATTGSGRVYDPNPVQQTGDTGLRDNNDAPSVTLDAARVMLPLQGLADLSPQLTGDYVDVTSTLSGCTLPYSPGLASEPTRVYDYSRSDDRFEEASTYAAIDGVRRYIGQLGFSDPSFAIRAQVHCIPQDNSGYSASDNALRFGDGGVDDAEDAEIVVHEYGHAVQSAIVPGFGPGKNTEQRAIGEGFGDLLATMYYLDRGNGPFLSARRFCFGDWDATTSNPANGGAAGSGCVRWINGREEITGGDIGIYIGTPQLEHDDGRFWSAAMTCVFTRMGGDAAARNALMRIVLAHLYDLAPDPLPTGAFEDSVAALLAADVDLLGGANQTAIKQCADQRLGTSLYDDPTPPEITPTVTSTGPPGNAGWSRGDVTVSWTVSDEESGVGTRTNCTNQHVNSDTAGLTFTCTAVSEGGMRSVSVTVKRDTLAPALAPAITPSPLIATTTATANPGATDALSGVAAASCQPLITATPGARAVTCSAADVAGNEATASAPYTVSPAAALSSSAVFPYQTLSRARLYGVKVRARCTLDCTAGVTLRVSAAVARKLKLARRPSPSGFVLGRASGKVAAGTTRTFTIRLSAKARRALRRARSVALSARLTASGPAGTARPVTVRRTLR